MNLKKCEFWLTAELIKWEKPDNQNKGERTMKRILPALLCLLLCTGCANIPEPEPEMLFTEAPTEVATEAETEPETEVPATAAGTNETAATEPSGETEVPEETEDEPETAEDEPEEPGEKVLSWQKAYRNVLRQAYRRSEHDDSFFALIQLNEDDIPELVILDAFSMELYCCEGNKAVLLLEDGYKGYAIEGQNVCYQPKKSLFSTAFSTMGGGSGFTIFLYEKLDTLHAERFYFDNSENVDGEMPYNTIWDRAEEFEVTDNGYHDVTLGESWVHIGRDFTDLWELTEQNAENAGSGWEPVSE